MRITWYGHAAFLLEFADGGGTRLILDPYRSPDCGGYLPVDDAADGVLLSHLNDKYHSHLGQIRGNFEVLRAWEFPGGTRAFRGLRLGAVPVFETPERLPGDEVSVTTIESPAEGLRVAFLGDLGHDLDDAELAPLVGSDVALAATGGAPTVDLGILEGLLARIGPRIAIPMHFKTSKIDLDILPPEAFLERAEAAGIPIRRVGGASAEVDRANLPGGMEVWVLDHAR